MQSVYKFKPKLNKYTLEFPSSEALIQSVEYLRKKRIFKSRLYHINGHYRLLIESIKLRNELLSLKEFCQMLYSDELQFEYTAEHGIPIIKEKAVSKIASAFFRDF